MTRFGRPVTLASALAVVAWGWHGLFLQAPEAPATLAPLCWFCHPWMTEEWKSSPHAMATGSRAFLDAVAKSDKPEDCYACHAPQPVLAAGLRADPLPRPADREQGVDCQSCHQDGAGAQVGPMDSAGSPFHPSVEDDSMRAASDLCAICHGSRNPRYDQETSYRASGYAAEEVSCQGCHMPREQGPIAYGTRHTIRERARHDILGPADAQFVSQAVRLDLTCAAGRADASLTSLAVGHLLPGSAGPRVSLTLVALDAAGQELAQETLTLAWDGEGPDSRLAPGASRPLFLALPPGAAKARAVAQYTDDARELAVPLAQVEATP
jgi:hypothetical protein